MMMMMTWWKIGAETNTYLYSYRQRVKRNNAPMDCSALVHGVIGIHYHLTNPDAAS